MSERPWEVAGTHHLATWEEELAARMADIVIPLPPGFGIVTTAPEPTFQVDKTPVRERMEEWARMVEATRRPPSHVVLVGQAKWHRMMMAADEADRASLTKLREDGLIIVSPFLPAADEAYLMTPDPADYTPRLEGW